MGETEHLLQAHQEKFNEIHQRMGINKSELYQVQELVKRLNNQQRQLKNRIDELKEFLESCNNNAIETFVSS